MDYHSSKAWTYIEARRLAERNITNRSALFETGFGSSGSPTIGTFSEAARTTMVRRAYEDLMGYGRNTHTRLIVFADDMDALRRVPDYLEDNEMMHNHIGYAVSSIPDPHGAHESFAHHNNAMLRQFLDRFGFEYEFMSATACYESGLFNDALLAMSRNYQKVRGIILPTLGAERRESYCAFMPRLPDGRIISEGVSDDPHNVGLVNFHDGVSDTTYDVRNGNTKCQWKADWALRWLALGVDYEMCGKDLIDSVKLSSKIVRAIGGSPPVNMIYEMFLDEDGHKISKSKGNGLTIDEWLRWGTQDSLSAYLYREPNRAKKLYPAVVAQAMDDYWDAYAKYPTQTPEQRLGNPLHHIGVEIDEAAIPPFSYQLLLNIAQTAAVDEPRMLWGFVNAHFPLMTGDQHVNAMTVMYRVFAFYRDQLAGRLNRRAPTTVEAHAMRVLADRIESLHGIGNDLDHEVGFEPPITDEQVQFEVYEVGKQFFGKEKLRDWFRTLYEVLLGQESGPRFGAFAVLLGIKSTVALLREVADQEVEDAVA